eukprot:152017-Heterocapsa_arctica.AAC.1
MGDPSGPDAPAADRDPRWGAAANRRHRALRAQARAVRHAEARGVLLAKTPHARAPEMARTSTSRSASDGGGGCRCGCEVGCLAELRLEVRLLHTKMDRILDLKTPSRELCTTWVATVAQQPAGASTAAATTDATTAATTAATSAATTAATTAETTAATM